MGWDFLPQPEFVARVAAWLIVTQVEKVAIGQGLAPKEFVIRTPMWDW